MTRAVLRGGHYRGAVTAGDAVAHATEGSRLGSRSLVFCYTPDLDLTGHARGVNSEAWLSQLRLVDRFAEELASRLPSGTALYVTADHGMIDVSESARVDFDSSPRLAAGVRALADLPVATTPPAAPRHRRPSPTPALSPGEPNRRPEPPEPTPGAVRPEPRRTIRSAFSHHQDPPEALRPSPDRTQCSC